MKEVLAGCKFAKIDDEDFERVNKFSWRSYKNRNVWYAETGCSQNNDHWFMHELIMGKAPLGFMWDHCDGDGLNNQKSNLRLATNSQNKMNGSKYKCNTTGYKGVTLRRERGTYRAQIRKGGRLYIIGTFHTAEEAARAYDERAKVLFGKFARLNF